MKTPTTITAIGRMFLALLTAFFFCAQTAIAATEQERNEAIAEATTLLQDGNYSEAINILEPIARDVTATKEGALALAEAYYYSGNYSRAESLYQQTLTLSPTPAEETRALTALGNIYLATRNYSKGIPVFQRILETRPNDKTTLYNLATLSSSARKTADAKAYAEQALNADPNYMQALTFLVGLYDSENDMQGAVSALAKAKERAPGNAEIARTYAAYAKTKSLQEGERLFKMRHYEASIPFFATVVDADPGAIAASFMLAQAYYNIDDFASTRKILIEMGKRQEVIGDPENAKAYYTLALYNAIQMGDFGNAALYGERALVYNRNDVELNRMMGYVNEMRSDTPKALEYYGRAERGDAKDSATVYRTASIYVKNADYKAAIDYLDQAMRRGVRTADVRALHTSATYAYHMQAGNALYAGAVAIVRTNEAAAQTKFQQSIIEYEKALKADRKPAALVSIGNAMMQTKNYSRAERFFNEALSKDSNYVNAYFALLRIYQTTGNQTKQKEAMAKLEALNDSNDPAIVYSVALNYCDIEGNEGFTNALSRFTSLTNNETYKTRAIEQIAFLYYDRGVVSFNGKNYDSAAKDFNVALRYLPDFPDALQGLRRVENAKNRASLSRLVRQGDQAFEQGRRAEAIRLYAEILEIDPALYNVRVNLATLYSRDGRYLDALATLSPAMEENANDRRMLIISGRAYQALGDYENAERSIAKALELNPNDYEAQTALGALYSARREYDRAIQTLLRAKALAAAANPSYLDAAQYLGRAYYDAGLYDNAFDEFAAVLAKNPRDIVANFNTAIIYYRKNRYADALTYLTRVEQYDASRATVNGRIFQNALGRIQFYRVNYAAARNAFEKALAASKGYPEETTIEYTWWLAKTRVRIYLTDRKNRNQVMAILNECIVNAVNDEISYRARLEMLRIDPKDITIFANRVALFTAIQPLVAGDRQYAFTTASSVIAQSTDVESTLWEKPESAPPSASFVLARDLYYTLINGDAVARDPITGEEVWRVRGVSSRVYAATGNTFVCLTDNNNVIALRDGKRLWTKNMQSREQGAIDAHGDKIYVTLGGTLTALSLETGEALFAVQTDEGAKISRVVRAENELVVFLSEGRRTKVQFYNFTGEKIAALAGDFDGTISKNSAVLIDRQTVFFATSRNRLVGVSLASHNKLWETRSAGVRSMSISGNTFYVSEGTSLKRISRLSGETQATYPVRNADDGFATVYTRRN